jgi:DNA-binding MarR family transcriptional regulator
MTESSAAGTAAGRDSALDQEIFEAMMELIVFLKSQGEKIAQGLTLNASDCFALRQIGGAVTMKELGKRLHCDPSFVTTIADALEKRGLARREVDPADRRVKNLVLTADGVQVRSQLERAFRARMPWANALDEPERASLLALLRKMIRTVKADTAVPASSPGSLPPYPLASATRPTGGHHTGEVNDSLSTASAGGD